jgi:hypothetical protein
MAIVNVCIYSKFLVRKVEFCELSDRRTDPFEAGSNRPITLLMNEMPSLSPWPEW